MSRTLKTLVVVVAVVVVLTLAAAGTIYAFGGDRCGSGRCGSTNDCTGSSHCNRSSCP